MSDVFVTLHNATYGSQDSALESGTLNTPAYGRVLRHNTTTIGHVVSYLDVSSNTEALANIRILGSNWSSAELQIGGLRFGRIYRFMGMNSFPALDEGRCLPFAENHRIGLSVVCENGVSGVDVEYDVVEITPQEMHRFSFTNIQYTGPEGLTASNPRLRLHFNHPVTTLNVKFEKPVESVSLHINVVDTEIEFKKLSDTEFTLDFGDNSINFSQVDSALLHVRGSENNTINCYAKTKEIIHIMAGMYGLAFQK